jgi:S-adenosylmethionine hydrolase
VPVVALLTDFGTRDHYVGVMKGVVLSVCPDAALVDISHEIPPQDVTVAAITLSAAYRYFPPGTVFLVVVDPGVGTPRRALAAEAGGYAFVGPDNGVFSEIFRELPPRIVELREPRYARPAISRTFEGRDRFAPAAGWLARGVTLEALGPPVLDPVRLEMPQPAIQSGLVSGEVIHVDRFGNLISNIDRAVIARAGRPVDVRVGPTRVPLVNTYGEAPPGALCALFGSSERLEVAVNGGSAASVLGAGRGARVEVAVSP